MYKYMHVVKDIIYPDTSQEFPFSIMSNGVQNLALLPRDSLQPSS